MTMERNDIERRIASLTACLKPMVLVFTYPNGKSAKIAYKADERKFMLHLGGNAYAYTDDVRSMALLVMAMGAAMIQELPS